MKILKSPLLSPLQLNPSFSASLSWKSYLTIRWPTRPRQRVCGKAQPLHKSYNPCMMLIQMLRKATHFLFHAKCKFFFCIFNKWKEICITSFKKKKDRYLIATVLFSLSITIRLYFSSQNQHVKSLYRNMYKSLFIAPFTP